MIKTHEHHAKLYTGIEVWYDIAVDRQKSPCPDTLVYLGKGVIYSVDGVLIPSIRKMFFYRSKYHAGY